MKEPKLRTANKVIPPYPINQFPKSFIDVFGEEITYMRATKSPMSIEGNEWEQVFAKCIGAEWKPSNIGLDDVVLGNCCWSAKTLKATSKNIADQKEVRLISGRCSPVFSYESKGVSADSDPQEIGQMVLGIWNERVSSRREVFKFARTVVLMKGSDYDEYLVFETNTIRYDPDDYSFVWNKHGNLEGLCKANSKHRFTWQPHGSQLTIIEDIPPERMHVILRKPPMLDKQQILKEVGFQHDWVRIAQDPSGNKGKGSC